MFFTVEETEKITSGKIINKGTEKDFSKITTDSRLADNESLFVAITGENNDGHDFIESAYNKGCRIVLISNDVDIIPEVTYIKVKDTIVAMGDIAREHIKKINPKKVAITGSVGKTTTKEIIYSVLANNDKTLKTEGNFNNNIGLPLTAFRLKDEKTAVFEMGMNHFNEIDYLSKIVRPDVAVITNIGYSHIENLGSREGILKAKSEIFNNMDDDKMAVLNADDPFLYSLKDKIKQKIIFVGINNPHSDILAKNIKEEEGKTTFTVDEKTYTLNVTGSHNVYNALSAIAVGRLFNESYENIKEGLLLYKPVGMRQNTVEKNGYKVIVDCYNASPDSFISSLNVLEKTKGDRKIAVFGSVAELGEIRDKLLYEVGKEVKKHKVDYLITVTDDALSINKGARDEGQKEEMNFKNNKEVINYLKSFIKSKDVILIKGSRLYKMEEISESLLK